MRKIERDKEPKLFHLKNGEIEYHPVESELWYSYEETFETRAESGAHFVHTYHAKGIIPQEVIDRSAEAVKEFTQQLVARTIYAEKQRRRLVNERLEQLRHLLEFENDDDLIRGHIRSADGTRLTAELLEPYQGVQFVNFNMFSAMSGHSIFTRRDPPSFSEYAIEKGIRMLTSIYRLEKIKAENPGVNKIADRLNNDLNL